jgi:hypothetical protein
MGRQKFCVIHFSLFRNAESSVDSIGWVGHDGAIDTGVSSSTDGSPPFRGKGQLDTVLDRNLGRHLLSCTAPTNEPIVGIFGAITVPNHDFHFALDNINVKEY